MPYQYLDDIATADVAFRAWGQTEEEMLISACEAAVGVMVEDLETIAPGERRSLSLGGKTLEDLLFRLLGELIYLKDTERLLLRVTRVKISAGKGGLSLSADTFGERLDPEKHRPQVDIKAVTLHQFQVKKIQRKWQATVVLDI